MIGELNMRPKITYEFVKEYFEKEGYMLISKEYNRAKDYLITLCPNFHEYLVTWDAFRGGKGKKGRRCPICSKRKITIDDVIDLCNEIGYQLLSKVYKNSKTKLSFKCPEGHTFPMTWSNIKHNNRRCPECQGLKRWSFEEVKKYFENRGYILFTDSYENVNQRLNYQCPEGHLSSTTFNKFKNAEHGCDYCGGSKTLDIEFVRSEFAKAGLLLLKQKYINAGEPIKFECFCGNIDTVTYRRFKWAGKDKNPKRKCWECMIPEGYYTLNEDERIKERKYPEYYSFVRNVKIRDNYTCVCCGYSGYVVAHHLDGYSWCVEKRTDVNNGISLCNNCHDDFHSIYGFFNNTEEQFCSFMNSR